MEWKVRALDDQGNPIEPKQKEEVVQEVVQDPKEVEVQEEQVKTEDNAVSQEEESNGQAEEQVIQQQEEKEVEKPFELDDNSILSYLKDRHNKQYESIEVLLNNEQKSQSDSVPEDVQKFMDFQKETGRSFEDYANLQKDWSSVDDQSIMREFYAATKPHLDSSEVDYLLSENYSYDAEIDDEKEIKKKQIELKEEVKIEKKKTFPLFLTLVLTIRLIKSFHYL